MPVVVDALHLVVIVAGIGVGVWALLALRSRLPRGRFVAFGGASVGALFGCSALGGEIGLLPPTAWFVVVMGLLAAIVGAGLRLGRPASSAWR
jgi:hypothetical protein